MPEAMRHAYFVGIGGIGMSALAQWLSADGWEVDGSDRTRSDITAALERAGIMVDPAILPTLPNGTSLLVYSDAVPPTDSLRVAARVAGVREVSYAELLGELTRSFLVVAIAGSHGKSTTTALTGLLLEAAGLDPTVVVGTRVPQWRRGVGGRASGVGNFRRGQSDIAVVEADEYREHFLALSPTIAVVTSVDYDHVDAFPTPESYAAAFAAFVQRVGAGGTVVLAAQDAAVMRLRSHVTTGCTVTTFALSAEPGTADVVATSPVVRKGRQRFQLTVRGQDWGLLELTVPGEHVVRNAAAAVAATLPFAVSPDTVRRALETFHGTWRRFEVVGTVNSAPVISDYAHHPTELRALAAAVRQGYPGRRVLIAFQPHQHARTRAFGTAFLEALAVFDAVILAEVYDVTGREESERVTTKDWVAPLQEHGRTVTYASTLDMVAEELQQQATSADVVLVVGAGDIDTVARRFMRS